MLESDQLKSAAAITVLASCTFCLRIRDWKAKGPSHSASVFIWFRKALATRNKAIRSTVATIFMTDICDKSNFKIPSGVQRKIFKEGWVSFSTLPLFLFMLTLVCWSLRLECITSPIIISLYFFFLQVVALVCGMPVESLYRGLFPIPKGISYR